MGKKILNRLLNQEDQNIPKVSKSILDNVLEQTSSLDRESANMQQVSQSFEGDSQYDEGLGYGVDQSRLRARNQPLRDQVGNTLLRIVPAIGLDILETTGDIVELFDRDDTKEYTNAITELAKEGKKKLDEDLFGGLKNYQETPANEFAPLSDSGWWVNHAEGLITSIASFGLTGAGIL
jgi:hypothetical protein